MKVNEIFYSIEGEGIRAGYPCVFVRLHGCNLNCLYCDTRYSCDGDLCREMTIYEILQTVREYGCKRVTITGGEPTLQSEFADLVKLLAAQNFQVNVETNGTISASDILDITEGYPMITMDHKSPSSGMNSHMSVDNYLGLRATDVLKFVVGSREDLIDADRVIEALTLQHKCPRFYLSPIFGQIEPKDIVEFMKEHHYNNVRIQLQMHKFIWPPEMKGV